MNFWSNLFLKGCGCVIVATLFLNVFSKSNKMELYDTKIASLTYLTNPLYQQVLKQQTQHAMHSNKSDIKFYRKRITALTKDMLKGEIPDNSYIKTIYETYVNGLIKYFKMVDTSDIIQQQYLNADVGANGVGANGVGANGVGANGVGANGVGANGVGANGVGANGVGANGVGANEVLDTNSNKEITIDNTMMRKHTGVSTLDNFVIKQPNDAKETRIIPLIIDVDLKEPSLKKKGVKEKIKKSEKTVKEKI